MIRATSSLMSDSDTSDSESEAAESSSFTETAVTNESAISTGIKRIINASSNLEDIAANAAALTSKKKKKEKEGHVNRSCDPPKTKVYKKNNKSSWVNIFVQCKAVVSIVKDESYGDTSSGMAIRFCDVDFLSTFECTSVENGSPFTDFMGKASSLDTLRLLENSLRGGRSCTEYINLYKSDGVTPLSCHVCLLPLKSHLCDDDDSSFQGDRNVLWGVITIRSASAVGNARFSGLSILGMERVSESFRQEYYTTKIMNALPVESIRTGSANASGSGTGTGKKKAGGVSGSGSGSGGGKSI